MAKMIDKQVMLNLIIDAKRNEPENVSSFSEWLAEYLTEHLPTLTPPNEPLTCEGCYYIKNDDYSPCAWCIRSKENEDYYRCPPEGEVDT